MARGSPQFQRHSVAVCRARLPSGRCSGRAGTSANHSSWCGASWRYVLARHPKSQHQARPNCSTWSLRVHHGETLPPLSPKPSSTSVGLPHTAPCIGSISCIWERTVFLIYDHRRAPVASSCRLPCFAISPKLVHAQTTASRSAMAEEILDKARDLVEGQIVRTLPGRRFPYHGLCSPSSSAFANGQLGAQDFEGQRRAEGYATLLLALSAVWLDSSWPSLQREKFANLVANTASGIQRRLLVSGHSEGCLYWVGRYGSHVPRGCATLACLQQESREMAASGLRLAVGQATFV